MKQEFDTIGSMDIQYRKSHTEVLASQALGLFNYSSRHESVLNGNAWVLVPTSGMSFYAFLTEYRGKLSISRYLSDGTRGGEIFPEPFDIWYEPETIDKYLQSLEIPNEI